MPEIKIIAGLGNPGARYARTRHNFGFIFLDYLTSACTDIFKFQNPEWREKFGAEICQGDLGGLKLIFLKPQSFMNLSGGPVSQALQFYKVSPQSLVVVHDDIDLPMGAIRVKRSGGDGGHNGVKSIAQTVGSQDFFRIRLGVGRPIVPASSLSGGDSERAAEEGLPRPVADWVLSKFLKEEEGVVVDAVSRASQALQVLLAEGLESAQRRFN